jgi:hypothetical protein
MTTNLMSCYSLGVTTNINVSGNVTASLGTITAKDLSITGGFNNTGLVSAGSFSTTGNIDASGCVTAGTFVTLGDVNAGSFTTLGTINAGSLSVPTLTLSGSITALSFNATSDYRVKEDVRDLDNKIFNVNKLRPVTYYNTLIKETDIGFIAHEVQEQYSFMVSGEKDGDKNQSLNYISMIGILVKEVQDLKQDVKYLRDEITILKSK